MVELQKAGERTSNVENERTIQDTEFRYGRGTILDTITEKNSNGTMKSVTRPRSADDLHKVPFLGHRDSFLVTKSLGRQHSFSLDDLHLIKQSYHEVCHEIYASPKVNIRKSTSIKPLVQSELHEPSTNFHLQVPLRDPLERPSTPPGMPSWTAAQTAPLSAMPYSPNHIHRTPNRVQRFLGIESSGITFSSRIPRPEAPRVVSAPITVSTNRQAARFRPPRSAYGALSRHPFNNAPIATITQTYLPMYVTSSHYFKLSTESKIANLSTENESDLLPRPQPATQQRITFAPPWIPLLRPPYIRINLCYLSLKQAQ